MVEVGAQESAIPGGHKKNTIAYQKDLNSFGHVIRGDLHTLSVPVDPSVYNNLNPSSWSGRTIHHGMNPLQDASVNIDAKATRSVGGMTTHWTCATPELLKGVERPDIFSDDHWAELYAEAEQLIGTSTTEFDDSIRQQLVKYVLSTSFPDRSVKSLPLACKRDVDNPDFVTWSSSATIFGDITDGAHDNFTLLSEHLCTSLAFIPGSGADIGCAYVQDLRGNETLEIFAEYFVVCAGAVLTPQILAFCQVVLKRKFIDDIINDAPNYDPYHQGESWTEKITEHLEKYPGDPIPFPFNDPDPQVTIPVSEERPWHTQIHRDAFSYGMVPENYDQRLIVDFRWFTYMTPSPDTTPTFNYVLSKDDASRTNDMINDMVDVATKLGGFLPGAEPQYMPPGSALHICGTTRAGTDSNTSVVDPTSRVWGINNLYLGGNGVIPTGIAANPTLTNICFAIEGANDLLYQYHRESDNYLGGGFSS
ncbi:hypothetical protein B0I37DRAFT_412600 [Chaetomium sp. MPI-CAGE-AT-0009]|nr:hypothetical protein B0I37DRAFT_412600 [Chaetomium sp. MPI-CAGE-AT-0009]